jgi:hypothetical protein
MGGLCYNSGQRADGKRLSVVDVHNNNNNNNNNKLSLRVVYINKHQCQSSCKIALKLEGMYFKLEQVCTFPTSP